MRFPISDDSPRRGSSEYKWPFCDLTIPELSAEIFASPQNIRSAALPAITFAF
jgi:hypothetical protein